MSTFAIGDIHGCLTALETIFKQDLIKNGDTVVFLGDYIDRGPHSKGVLDWLIENKKQYHFQFILGNHEIMMITAKVRPDTTVDWLHYGGLETLDSYQINDDPNWAAKIDDHHWSFMESCKPYHEIGDYIFVHAGLEAGKPLYQQNEEHLFWKKFITAECYDPKKTVICGHTARKNGEIADFKHTICIDTYAYGGMWLTCLNVETKQFLKANDKGEIISGKL